MAKASSTAISGAARCGPSATEASGAKISAAPSRDKARSQTRWDRAGAGGGLRRSPGGSTAG